MPVFVAGLEKPGLSIAIKLDIRRRERPDVSREFGLAAGDRDAIHRQPRHAAERTLLVDDWIIAVVGADSVHPRLTEEDRLRVRDRAALAVRRLPDEGSVDDPDCLVGSQPFQAFVDSGRIGGNLFVRDEIHLHLDHQNLVLDQNWRSWGLGRIGARIDALDRDRALAVLRRQPGGADEESIGDPGADRRVVPLRRHGILQHRKGTGDDDGLRVGVALLLADARDDARRSSSSAR